MTASALLKKSPYMKEWMAKKKKKIRLKNELPVAIPLSK